MSLPEIPGEPPQPQVTHVHYHVSVPAMHGWLRFLVRDLETNPRSQFAVHKWGAAYWLANMPALALVFFLAPALWLKIAVLVLVEYSLYANFATDYGAMSAALAAMQPPSGGAPENREASERLLQQRKDTP